MNEFEIKKVKGTIKVEIDNNKHILLPISLTLSEQKGYMEVDKQIKTDDVDLLMFLANLVEGQEIKREDIEQIDNKQLKEIKEKIFG